MTTGQEFTSEKIEHAVCAYGVCIYNNRDFTPLVLELFDYRRINSSDIEWLDHTRRIKHAKEPISDADLQRLEKLHDIIVGNGDSGGSPPPSGADEGGSGSDEPDYGGSEGMQRSIAGTDAAGTEEDDEEVKPSPIIPVQEPAPARHGHVEKDKDKKKKKAKPLTQPPRKKGGVDFP